MHQAQQRAAAVGSDNKVVVQFKNTGDAPILKTSKFKLPATAKFSTAAQHLRKLLSLADSEPLFLYCQCAFAPSPDELLSDVAECFADNNGVLLVNYATIPAWG
jgi:ubiquitin-like protein ATG12